MLPLGFLAALLCPAQKPLMLKMVVAAVTAAATAAATGKGVSCFVVKVQVPISSDGATSPDGNCSLLVYDKKRRFETFVGPDQQPAFATLRAKVRDEGLNGCKGYFNARLAEDGLVYVNSASLLPTQPW